MMKASSLARAIPIAIALASSNPWSAAAQTTSDRKDCSCNPDPHFSPFEGSYYDYHGGCKLVLLRVPDLDLHVHISTFPVVGYSLIDEVGIKVGDDEAVINAGTDPLALPSALDGYPLMHTTNVGGSAYELQLNDGQYVRVTEWNGSMSVRVEGADSDFSGADGMCGDWDNAGFFDRDGNGLANEQAMADEWRVSTGQGDPDIIGTSTECDPAIPHGGQCADVGCLCIGDQGNTGRCQCVGKGDNGDDCLCENGGCVTHEDIDEACKDIEDSEQQEMCKYDVQMTGDVIWGDAPFYQPVQPLAFPTAGPTAGPTPRGKSSKSKRAKAGKGSKKGSRGGSTCSIEEMAGLFVTPHYLFNVPNIDEDLDPERRKLADDHGRKLGHGEPHYDTGPSDLSYGTMLFHLPEGAGGNGAWGGGYHGPRGVMEVEWCNTVCYDDVYAGKELRRLEAEETERKLGWSSVNTGEGCVFNYQQLVAVQSGFSRDGVIPFVVAPIGGGGRGTSCSAGGLLGVDSRCRRRRLDKEGRHLDRCLESSWCNLYEDCRPATNNGNDDGVCDTRRRLSDATEADPAAGQDREAGPGASSRRLDPKAQFNWSMGCPYCGMLWNLAFAGEYDCDAGEMYVGGNGLYGGPLALSSAGPATKADREGLGLGPFTCLDPEWMPPAAGGWGAPPPAPAYPHWNRRE